MPSFEGYVDQAIADGVMQGVVMYGTNTKGESYKKAFGKTSLDKDAAAMQIDTPMQIASMTKLLTTIAVLQIVEKGLIGLDDDVGKIIPELVREGVLKSVDDQGRPTTTPIKNKITLRLLLTHSTGSIYDMGYRKIQSILDARDPHPTPGEVVGRATFPLLFEPGTSWVYGYGIDWAGLVLERLTGSSLDNWMKQHMWPQIGVKHISFAPFAGREIRDKLPKIATRDDEGLEHVPDNSFLNDGNTGCFGGWGAIASMDEYIKVLHSLLANDGKLLKKETADQMFQPQLTKASKATLHKIMDSPIVETFVGDFPDPEQYDHGIGGLLIERDNEGRRKKGTLTWSGMANCFWFIDREAGVCGVLGTQVLPPGDRKVRAVIKEFELELNRRLGASRARM